MNTKVFQRQKKKTAQVSFSDIVDETLRGLDTQEPSPQSEVTITIEGPVTQEPSP